MAKLERKLTKIFANNSGSQGTTVYGSKASGTVQYSKDLDDLQSAEWEIGREAGVIANSAPVLEDDNTVDYVMSRQIKYIQQMGFCEWLATETYYINSFCAYNGVVYKSIVDDNINNNPANDDGTHWEEFKSGGGGLNLFDITHKDHILSYNEKFGLELLGEYVYKTAVAGTRYGYPDFYNKVLAEYNDPNNTDDTTTIAGITIKVNQNGHQFYDIADKSAVDTVYNNTGIAWFYGVDTANERIFLPRNDYCFVNGNVGEYFAGELPNLSGYFNSSGNIGADNLNFTTTLVGGTDGGGSGNTLFRVNYNPSRTSNVKYDKGIKPTGVGVYVYMCVGNVAQEEAQGQYIDMTTTENDTIPLFTANIFEFDAGQKNPSWLRANGNYVSGEVYQTCYTELVRLLTTINDINLKVVDYDNLDPNVDYSEYWIVNQTNQTFRTPVKISKMISDKVVGNGLSIGLISRKNTTDAYTKNALKFYDGGSYSALQQANANGTPVGTNVSSLAATQYSQRTIGLDTDKETSGVIVYTYDLTELEQAGLYLFFKVANAVENLEIINGAGVLSALNNKLDLTENMIPSSKYDNLTLGASGTTYVAPANGWFYCRKTSNGNHQYLNIYNRSKCNMSIEGRASVSGVDAATIIPVAKNDIVSVDYSVGGATKTFVFIYSINN